MKLEGNCNRVLLTCVCKTRVCSKLKEKRKRIQEENRKRKEAIKQESKKKSLKGTKRNETETDRLLRESAAQEAQHQDDDDAHYYKEEVGEEPEQGKHTEFLNYHHQITIFFLFRFIYEIVLYLRATQKNIIVEAP